MKKSFMNRKNMVEATLVFLDSNASKWQGIAKIGEAKNQLTRVFQSIESSAENQDKYAVNIGKIKTDVKRVLCEKADIINDIVEVYALMNGNEELAQRMSDSSSDLFKMKNDDCARRVKLIINETIACKDVLITDYGLTEEMLADLQADYDRFMELNGKPREYQIKSSVATKSLDELFAESNNILNKQLDNLMKIFKRRDSNLYNEYLKARMVIDH